MERSTVQSCLAAPGNILRTLTLPQRKELDSLAAGHSMPASDQHRSKPAWSLQTRTLDAKVVPARYRGNAAKIGPAKLPGNPCLELAETLPTDAILPWRGLLGISLRPGISIAGMFVSKDNKDFCLDGLYVQQKRSEFFWYETAST